MRCSIASRLSLPPRRVGNSGVSWSPRCSSSQSRSTATVPLVSGVIRSLRPLPWQATCAPGAEVQVGAGEPDQFGDPQAGLDGEEQQRVVASPGPGGLVAGGEQRVDLGLGEVGDQRPVEAFGWDRQHPGDALGVFGVGQRGEAEQRVDRGQPGVAGADAVAALVFEVVEEAGDQRRVEVGEVQLRGRACRCGRRRSRAAAARCRGRRRWCGRWRGAAGSAGR